MKPTDHSKNPYSLLEAVSGWMQCSIDIEAAINKAKTEVANGIKSPKEAFLAVLDVLEHPKNKQFGTMDGEPKMLAWSSFMRGLGLANVRAFLQGVV